MEDNINALKYKITRLNTFQIRLDTNFVITDVLYTLLKICKGLTLYNSQNRYQIIFGIGLLFNAKEVNKSLSKILDSYIPSHMEVILLAALF